jgi:hypothetical protein
MTVREIEWKRGTKLDDWSRAPFVTMDPDKRGAIAITGSGYGVLSLDEWSPSQAAGLLARSYGCDLLSPSDLTVVIEAPYIGKSLGGVRLAWRPGLYIGALSAMGFRVTVVWVPPAVWQAWVRRQTGSKAKVRKDLKQMALDYNAAQGRAGRLPATNKERRQGAADALCIYDWWQSVVMGG